MASEPVNFQSYVTVPEGAGSGLRATVKVAESPLVIFPEGLEGLVATD